MRRVEQDVMIHILRRERKKRDLIESWTSAAAICTYSDVKLRVRTHWQVSKSYPFTSTYEGGLILIFLLTRSCFRPDPCHLTGKKLEVGHLHRVV